MTRSVLVLAFLATLSCRPAVGDSFDRAASAAGNAKFREAAKLFAEAAASESDPVRRAKAEIRLANIEWRAMRKYDEARARLQRVASGEHEQFAARHELARLAIDRKDYAAARAEARNAMGAAKTKRERDRAAMAMAQVVIESRDTAELRGSIDSLRRVIARQGPISHAALLLLKAALLAGDGAAAMEAIDGYYHVSKFAGPPNAIAAAHAELTSLLPSWRGTDPERPAIVRGLAGVRFFEAAALVARDGAPADIVAYAAAIRRLEDATNEYYRQTVLGDGDSDDLRKASERELRTLWPAISNEKLDREKAAAELAKRFGSYINIGRTGGFIDLHFGHVVADRTLQVEQYGRKAAMHFVELDAMVSNGLGTWISDGAGGDGGWATSTDIYQVRSQYANGPLRNYQLLFDDEVRAEEEKETAEETARDRERAKTRPIGEFPGLCKRLHRQYLDGVAAELRDRGLEGEAFRDAFLARVERDIFQYSILLHEGRHAIDKLSKEKFKAWELEYRAKLSEIALAGAPRKALESILDNTIGGDSPHGKANELLAKGLVAWMEANRAAIRGLDPSLPMLPQADKLTDEQIKAAIRSLDPMAERRLKAGGPAD
ncbi:MAG TPA: hypothetical protein VNA69_09260 [Thermoanaerobaculia bacterium]|nr:hypothetical protein [Thermoanaerobaculia bacterium]